MVLGGRAKNSHIELHDVRWVIGERIEDTFEQLCNEWFGYRYGLHIDSYMKVIYIDGYMIRLEKQSSSKNDPPNNKCTKENPLKSLWFVNIGGYKPCHLSEQHEFGLVVAETAQQAKTKAKRKFLKNAELKHKDDISSIQVIKDVDNCHSIKTIGDWQVTLVADKNKRSQTFTPEWYGFMRIDKKNNLI